MDQLLSLVSSPVYADKLVGYMTVSVLMRNTDPQVRSSRGGDARARAAAFIALRSGRGARSIGAVLIRAPRRARWALAPARSHSRARARRALAH
jgi:hypothetical protein